MKAARHCNRLFINTWPIVVYLSGEYVICTNDTNKCYAFLLCCVEYICEDSVTLSAHGKPSTRLIVRNITFLSLLDICKSPSAAISQSDIMFRRAALFLQHYEKKNPNVEKICFTLIYIQYKCLPSTWGFAFRKCMQLVTNLYLYYTNLFIISLFEI